MVVRLSPVPRRLTQKRPISPSRPRPRTKGNSCVRKYDHRKCISVVGGQRLQDTLGTRIEIHGTTTDQADQIQTQGAIQHVGSVNVSAFAQNETVKIKSNQVLLQAPVRIEGPFESVGTEFAVDASVRSHFKGPLSHEGASFATKTDDVELHANNETRIESKTLDISAQTTHTGSVAITATKANESVHIHGPTTVQGSVNLVATESGETISSSGEWGHSGK